MIGHGLNCYHSSTLYWKQSFCVNVLETYYSLQQQKKVPVCSVYRYFSIYIRFHNQLQLFFQVFFYFRSLTSCLSLSNQHYLTVIKTPIVMAMIKIILLFATFPIFPLELKKGTNHNRPTLNATITVNAFKYKLHTVD